MSLCAISKRTCALTIAGIQFFSAIYFLGCLLDYNAFSDEDRGWSYVETVKLIVTIINMLMPLVLVNGAIQKRTSMIKSWLIWEAISALISLAMIISPFLPLTPRYFIFYNSDYIYIETVISFVIQCVFVGLVYTYYEEVVLDKKNSEEKSLHFQKEAVQGETRIDKVAITSIV